MKGFVLDTQTIAIVLGVIIPLITGVITKQMASSGLKAVITLLLSSIAGWFAIAQAGVTYGWKEVVVAIFYAWGTAIVSYYGLTKPTTIAPKVAEATKSFGLGRAA